MNRLKASNRDKARNEGRPQVELAAEIRRAYELYEQRGRANRPRPGRLGTGGRRDPRARADIDRCIDKRPSKKHDDAYCSRV